MTIKRRLLVACAVGVIAAPVWAGPITPRPGSAERKAICDALRKPVMKDFGVKPVFVIQTLNVLDNWAFLFGELQREDGSAYNVEEIHRQRTGDNYPFDGDSVYGLLRKEGGRWKVMACAVAPTDAAYVGWHKSFGAPRSVFGELAPSMQ